MYLEALGLGRDKLVQMMGITFGISTAALARGARPARRLPVEASFVSRGGGCARDHRDVLGARLRAHLGPATFRKWLAGGAPGRSA